MPAMTPKTWTLIAVLPLVLVLAQCGFRHNRTLPQPHATMHPGDHERSITVDGRHRSYIVHVPPAYTSRAAHALVVVLHGGGGTAKTAMRMTGMSAKADHEGFLVVYPNGTGRLPTRSLTWNAGTCCGYAVQEQIDDVTFVARLLDALHHEFTIDDRRIYATGISNGAMLAYRLACELDDRIAAIAPVAGAMAAPACEPAHPMPVMIFHGTADRHVRFDGGASTTPASSTRRVDRSVADAMSFWVAHNQCAAPPHQQQHGSIRQRTYAACRDGTEVVLITILGGGHAWPGGEQGSAAGDAPTQDISATDMMWAFFARHAKP